MTGDVDYDHKRRSIGERDNINEIPANGLRGNEKAVNFTTARPVSPAAYQSALNCLRPFHFRDPLTFGSRERANHLVDAVCKEPKLSDALRCNPLVESTFPNRCHHANECAKRIPHPNNQADDGDTEEDQNQSRSRCHPAGALRTEHFLDRLKGDRDNEVRSVVEIQRISCVLLTGQLECPHAIRRACAHSAFELRIRPFVRANENPTVLTKDGYMMAGRGGSGHLPAESIDEALETGGITKLATSGPEDLRFLLKSVHGMLNLRLRVTTVVYPGRNRENEHHGGIDGDAETKRERVPPTSPETPTRGRCAGSHSYHR